MPHGELSVQTEVRDGVPTIIAAGEIDLATVDLLRTAASDLVKEGAQSLVFDLRQVNYIDSSGLGVLVATRRALGQRSEAVTVLAAAEPVLQALRITGLDRVLEVRREVAVAAAATAKPAKTTDPATRRRAPRSRSN